MTKHLFRYLLVAIGLLALPLSAAAATPLTTTLAGRILLQVESHGEAWYVDPMNGMRSFLGRPDDAYQLMRAKGLGIRHAELVSYLADSFPSRLSGRILLDIESRGEAYYILPATLHGIYLGHKTDAFNIMRTYGLGISNADLAKIPTDPSQQPTALKPNAPAPDMDVARSAIEKQTFDAINQHRTSIGISALVWNNTAANAARQHSTDMATGTVAFSHDGFSARIETIRISTPLTYSAENVAYDDSTTPAITAVEAWLNSQGHRANIENAIYNQTGVGVTQTQNGRYYFTQIFITAKK